MEYSSSQIAILYLTLKIASTDNYHKTTTPYFDKIIKVRSEKRFIRIVDIAVPVLVKVDINYLLAGKYRLGRKIVG